MKQSNKPNERPLVLPKYRPSCIVLSVKTLCIEHCKRSNTHQSLVSGSGADGLPTPAACRVSVHHATSGSWASSLARSSEVLHSGRYGVCLRRFLSLLYPPPLYTRNTRLDPAKSHLAATLVDTAWTGISSGWETTPGTTLVSCSVV